MSASEAIQIPSTRSLRPSSSTLSDLRSRDPLTDNPGTPSARYGSLNTTRPRLSFPPRSFSTSDSTTPRRERQWSVFEQVMEDESELWTGSIRSGAGRGRSNSYFSTSAQATPLGNVHDSFLGSGPRSPVSLMSSHTQQQEDEEDEDGYDSDDTSSTITRGTVTNATEPSPPVRWFSLHRLTNVPVLYRNILKCAIAYFIASLFTFNPYLSSFISDLTTYGDRERRPSPSGHMVATVAVYFNPAKTMGGMVEADFYCFLGLVYSAFVSLSSMTVFWWLEQKPGWEWLADIFVIVWIGVSMSVVAWMKVYMASPSFNTACSMTAILLFVVLVKEGGLETLLQVSFIVICGTVTSNIVCFMIWPQSATAALQANMGKTLDSFSTLLGLLTNAFLLEDGLQQPSHERLMKAVANHQSSFTSLKKNLKEAQSEWVKGSGGGRGRAYEDAVSSLNRLAQHLNGLRGGTRLQYDLTKAGMVKGQAATNADGKSNGKHRMDHVSVKELEERDEETAMLQAAADMFGDLVEDVGPPLRALSETCTTTLLRIRHSFQRRHKRNAFRREEFYQLVEGIQNALVNFETTSNHAVLRLYRRSTAPDLPVDVRDSNYTEDTQVLSSSDNEHVFLVYFFMFTLQEFAGELVSLVDAMERIYDRETRPSRWKRILSWFWSLKKKDSPRSRKPKKGQSQLRRRFSQYMVPALRQAHPSFPKVRPHAPNTIQTPWDRLTWIGKIKQRMWLVGTRLAQSDTKYGVKAGMATALLSAPAFFDSTRHIFVSLWGDWALISFFIVISPTIGATNFLSLHRVLGTVFGAGVAALVYTLFPDNVAVLATFGFFFSIPCFYYIVAKPQYVSASRFVLLTYNLTCLYCYNLRDKELSPTDIAIRRAIAVTGGVVWAALVSRFWWPAEARRELTKGLSEFCLNIGWLYTRLVAANSFSPLPGDDAEEHANEDSALSPAHARLSNSIKEFMAMELHLQIKLIELQGLLAQTQHEPRLKGPFPIQLYRGILTSLQNILDKLHSMRCVTTREEWYTSVRQEFIVPVAKERREMVGNIILGFSTLSSAFRLKSPLPPYLPPAEAARQRLVAAIRKLDVVRNRDAKGSRQLLFFAYALTMQGVTVELEKLGRTLQNAFGVIGQTPEEFEALFVDPAVEQRVSHSV
ncbi:unnamed protein product [Mycena citricolor]|uniref:DUF2421 domain-containing protein n=1 Tax=Mycena citricolor TaxID=2018698 RepID=A0AAD2JWG9_9AGAR|nr:unnamed protein product [Mycena citricolor]